MGDTGSVARQVTPLGLLLGLSIIPSVISMPSIPYADRFLDAFAFKLGADLMLSNTGKTEGSSSSSSNSAKKKKKKKKASGAHQE